MKIKNANDVKVGDVMVLGGHAWECSKEMATCTEWRDTVRDWFWRVDNAELQDLIDHGFEVTRKVEPVVFEAQVQRAMTADYIPIPLAASLFNHGQCVRVTVEPID